VRGGAAALVAVAAFGFFAPTALAAPSTAADIDPKAGLVAAMKAAAAHATYSPPVAGANDGQTNAAPATTATPTVTSTTDQSAGSTATATQQQPVNVVVIVRINSPGNDGPIAQSNISVALSSAANRALTAQDGLANASSTTTQQATPAATATQDAAQNLVNTTRLDSPGKNGPIAQTNAVLSAANALNTADTTQQLAAPTAAAQPQAHRAGAAASRKPPRPRRRDTAVRTPAASSQPEAATSDAATEPVAATPPHAAIQKPAQAHQRPGSAQKSRGDKDLPTLSSIGSGAAQVLSPFVPHTPPVVDATRSEDVSQPVLIALLVAGAAVAGTFALVRRAPARRRATPWRTPR
jgi:hypothetical protein